MPSYPGGVGLTIGIPLAGHAVVPEWGLMLMNLHPPMNYDVRFAMVKGKPVDEARNQIVAQAIREKSKYLFFLGDDVTPPAHAIRQLIFHMEHNPKMGACGAIYCHKAQPQAPLVFRGNGIGPFWDWKIGELFQVSGLGMDATLLRVEMLAKMEQPWFKTIDSLKDMMEGVNRAEHWTEDLYMCKKATDAGWEVWADGSLICGHWDYTTGICYFMPKNSNPMRQAGVKKGDKKIIDIGSGPEDSSYTTPEGEVLRVDIREDSKPDYRCDVRVLPFNTGEFDIVFSSHVLEHFGRAEATDVLDEWIRILKPDGELRLVLPNLEWAAQHIMNKEIDNDVMNVLYGAQTYSENFHKMGFTPQMIEQLLAERGFKKVIWDFHNYHMFCRAWKQPPDIDPQIGEINPIVRLKKDQSQPDVVIEKVAPKELAKPDAEFKVVQTVEPSTTPTETKLVEFINRALAVPDAELPATEETKTTETVKEMV